MYIQIPRLDAATAEGKFKQIEDFLFNFVPEYQQTISELQHEIKQLKEVK